MDQENISKGGETYLAQHWPKLDTIKSATVMGAAATAKPAAKPASTTKPAAKPAPTAPKPQQ